MQTPATNTHKQYLIYKLTLILLSGFFCTSAFAFDSNFFLFFPGNLVVSRSVYDNNPGNVQVGQVLPPNCASGCTGATNDGTYPEVWNNDAADGSFGITSKIYLDQVSPVTGFLINSLEVPNSSQGNI